jgi:Zn finger protein HypA/HybF involved in hydrogenase expression
MRKIFDVRCTACNHVQEEFGYFDDAFRCGECGGVSKRIISPVKCELEGVSGDFPGAAIKWARDRTKRGGNS